MSFNTWWKDYCRNHDSTPSFGTVFEAGRAESEAQIAALQSERDALREALLPFKLSDLDAFAYMDLAFPNGPRKYSITVTDRDLLRVHSLLSTPASGEPARKLCPDCKHSLEDNNHGFDQNDGFLDEHGELVHRGHCTYCRICNPHIFETVRKP